MTLTASKQRIVDDALKAGYEVHFGPHAVTIFKRRGVGVVLCDDGLMYRADVRLDLTVAIPTQKRVRKLLGI